VRVWDYQTGNTLKVLEGHAEGVSAVAYSPSGAVLVSASRDGTFRTWHSPSGEARSAYQVCDYSIHSLAFSSDGSYFVSASRNESVRVWDTCSGEQLALFEACSASGACSVAVSPCLIAWGSELGTVRFRSARFKFQARREMLTLLMASLPRNRERSAAFAFLRGGDASGCICRSIIFEFLMPVEGAWSDYCSDKALSDDEMLEV